MFPSFWPAVAAAAIKSSPDVAASLNPQDKSGSCVQTADDGRASSRVYWCPTSPKGHGTSFLSLPCLKPAEPAKRNVRIGASGALVCRPSMCGRPFPWCFLLSSCFVIGSCRLPLSLWALSSGLGFFVFPFLQEGATTQGQILRQVSPLPDVGDTVLCFFPAALDTWMRPLPFGKGSWSCLSSYYSFLEYVISGNAFVDKAFAEVHDFVECLMLEQVFIEFVCWALLKFAIAPRLSGGRGEMAMAAPPRCSLHAQCNSPLSSRPQPLGSGGDATPCEDRTLDCFSSRHHVFLQGGFRCVVAKPAVAEAKTQARHSRQYRKPCRGQAPKWSEAARAAEWWYHSRQAGSPLPARATNPRTGGRLTPRPAGANPRTGQVLGTF